MDASSDCARVIQWDTGVKVGELAQHTRGRAASCDFKPNRPMRIVTGGKDDSKCFFNAGPPFKRVVDGTPAQDCHTKGAVNCVRFSPDGSKIVSAGSDKMVCLYDGKTMALVSKLEHVHGGTVYSCAWNSTGTHILTCSADGLAKLLTVEPLEVVHEWNVIELLTGSSPESVPIGGMLVGCTFVKGDIPVCVSINGEISLLSKPPMLTSGIEDFERLTGHSASIAGLSIDHQNGLFYTGDTDGVLCQWDAASCRALKRLVPAESTNMLHKVHGEAAISSVTTVAGGSVLSAGWDDKVQVADASGTFSADPIALEAQPNAMASGTELVAILTVGGIVFVKGKLGISQ